MGLLTIVTFLPLIGVADYPAAQTAEVGNRHSDQTHRLGTVRDYFPRARSLFWPTSIQMWPVLQLMVDRVRLDPIVGYLLLS